jgi:bile acid:Na+ symporter, BASS family
VMVSLLPIDPYVKAGIVIMAVSPMAPFVPGKMLKTGAAKAYVFGLFVALIVVAIVLVPITIAVLSAITSVEVGVPVSDIAKLVLTSVLLPLAGGVFVASLVPLWAEKLAKIATFAAFLILIPIVLLILYKSGGAMLSLIGNGVLLAIVVAVAAGLAAGYLLGGPDPNHRMALANAAAARHPGIAMLIAQGDFDDQRVKLAIVLFLLTSVVVSGIYGAVANKRRTRHPVGLGSS